MAGKKTYPSYANNSRDLRVLRIEDLFGVLFKGPPSSSEINIKCESCSYKYRPPWEDQLKFEYSPAQSKDGARWGPSALPFPCPKCSAKNWLQFPQTEEAGHVQLYGDEAYREFAKNRFAFIYAFVSMLPEESVRFGKAIDECKRTIRPKDDPYTWKFHCADLRDERWRRKYGVKLTIVEINQIIVDLATSLSLDSSVRFLSASICVCEIPQDFNQRQNVQEIALYATLMSLTDYLTGQGRTPSFVLEAQTDSHKKNKIDFLVERVSRSLRYDLTFLYSARCKDVGLAVTAEKASTPELVAADIVAYIAARYIHTQNIGRHTEFPTELLGEVFWGSFEQRAFGVKTAIGFPHEFFATAPN